VNTGSTVDVWWVLLGNEIHTHRQMLVRVKAEATNIWLWQCQESSEWSSQAARVNG
jgi:hypothetical protein